MAKKKKGHGGLKFMAFVVVVVVLIVGISKGSKTETGQRILGNRQDRRLENTALTPRFGFASATLRVTVGSIYNYEGATVDLTSTSEMSIDRQSSTVAHDINIERTATEVAPGVNAVPFDALDANYSEIFTKLHLYESPEEPGKPWARSVVEPYYYGTELDEHYIPMIDDIMGFELQGLPSKPAPASSASGFKRPAVNTPEPPPDASRTFTYELDMETYLRVVPILAGRTLIDAPPETSVTLTLAFDDVGLLRFADVAIPDSVATTLAQQLGSGRSGVYRYTLEVTEISGEPIEIDLPTDVVDIEPSEILPSTVI